VHSEWLRPVWYRSRTTFGRQWPGLLSLTLLIALLGGLAMGSLGASRATASSFTDFAKRTHVPDLFVLDGTYNPTLGLTSAYNPALLNTLAHLPHVGQVTSDVGLNIGPVNKNSMIPANSFGINGIGTVNGLDFSQATMVVTQGRAENPTHANEVVLDSATARLFGVQLGQEMRVGWIANDQVLTTSPKIPADQQSEVRVVGTGATQATQMFQDQDSASSGSIELFTPALTSKLLACCSNTMKSALTVKGGSRFDAIVEHEVQAVLPKGFPFIYVQSSDVEARASRTLRPEAIALAVFGGIAAVASLLVAGQLIGRRLRLRSDELHVLRALGADPATTVGDGLVGTIGAVMVGALLAGLVAIGLSPLAPLGPVGPLTPTALRPDWTVIGIGVAIMALALTALAVAAAYRSAPHRVTARLSRARRSASAQALTASGLPLTAVTGIRFALEPGVGRSSVPVRSAILGAVLAVVVVVSTVTFGASLRTLVSHPALYGWSWTYAINGGAGLGDVPGQAAATLLNRDRSVARWTGVYFSTLEIDGTEVPVMGGTPRAPINPPLLSGHDLQSPTQVVLGATTLGQLHKKLGDTVAVKAGGRTTRLTIVGTATLPSIGVVGSSHLEMGQGALLSYRLIPQSARNIFNVKPPGPNMILVQTTDGVSAHAAFASLETIGRKLQIAGNGGMVEGEQKPAEILSYQTLGTTPTLLSAALAVGAIAALGLTLVASVRRRRTDLALLKILGFQKRQLAAAIAWQATVAVVIGCLVGIPLGIALGRALWQLFARGINAVPDPVVPWGSVLLIGLAAIVLANIVAAVPGRIAARTPTARLLRSE
jgi:hypothetical protein